MNRYVTSHISKATVTILEEAKLDYVTIENEQCCGFILYENGLHESAIDIMKKNQELFTKQKIDSILTSCPTCAYTFKVHYSQYLPNFNYKIIHISEFLASLIEEKKIKVNEKKSIKVTYHDPCHLLRGLHVTEEPRQVLNAILSQEIVEMAHSREASKCCGAGSGLRLSFSRLAQTLAQNRILEAKETGASVLVTSCPTCSLHLQENAKDIKVLDITEVIAKL
jgi:Fe-S oxidoreductase